MRKESALKYLILTFVMVASFFMISNASVKAVEMVNIQGNLFFELEEVESGIPEKGYSISGVVDSCETGQVCENITEIEVLTIPNEYNGYPIVGIKDGSNSFNSGVLENLSGIKIGKINGGENLKEIGVCAFCNLTVDKVDVSSSVGLIDDYAFFNSSISDLFINRYFPALGVENCYTNVTLKTFYGASQLDKIIFVNDNMFNQYKSRANVWKDFSSPIEGKYTYAIDYTFYNNGQVVDERTYYYRRTFGNLPANLFEEGLLFLGWYYLNSDEKISENSDPKILPLSEIMVNSVEARWELEAAVVEIASYFKGEKNESNKITYSGRNEKMDIVVNVAHSAPNYEVTYVWKSVIDGIVGNISNDTNIHKVGFVGESGVYNCYVTISYLGYQRTDIATIKVTIEPKKISVNVPDRTVYYGNYAIVDSYEIDENTPLVNGEIVKDFDFIQYTAGDSDIPVGDYENVLSSNIVKIGYSDDDNNYVDNYQITYNSGDLHVLPKKIEIGMLMFDNTITYGGSEELIAIINDQIYVSETNLEGISKKLVVTYYREMPSIINVGEYRVIGVSINDDNYEVKLDSNSYKIIIKPKKVNVSWSLDEELIYDGKVKEVSASYTNLLGEVKELELSIFKDQSVEKLVNSGTYKLVINKLKVDNNYELNVYEREVVIQKAESEFIGEVNQTKIYNGNSQNVDVELNHNESEIKYSDYSKCKNSHISQLYACKITASVEESENYNSASKTFSLYIKPYELFVSPDVYEIVYGDQIEHGDLIKEYKGFNDESVVVRFTKSGLITEMNVGYYNITGVTCENTNNYIVKLIENSGVNKLKVVPAPVEVRFYFYENLVYDGKIKNIGVKIVGASEDVGAVVSYGDKEYAKNAGNYKLTVNLTNENFYIDGENYIEFSIAKANYDLSNLKFENQEVKFNFKNHFIRVEGEIPEGLNLVYEIDGKKGNGTFLPFKHNVKVSFVGDYENYNYVDPIYAELIVDITSLLYTVLLVVLVSFVLFVLWFWLIKSGKLKIKVRRQISKKVLANIIKKNNELEFINTLINNTKLDLAKDETEEIIVEEPVKFVKNLVKTNPDEFIATSFVDNLFKASQETKVYYSEVKNELLSYEGIVSKIKRDYETFYLHNIPVARMNVIAGDLQVYFALDPTLYREEEYKHENVGKKKDFATVPLKLTVKSIQSLRHAKMFVRIIRRRENIKFVSNFVRTDYVRVYTEKENTFKMFKKVFVKKTKEEKN